MTSLSHDADKLGSLLEEHWDLEQKLIAHIQKRTIIVREEKRGEKLIFKPRFVPPQQRISEKLYIQFRTHFDSILKFTALYPYWVDRYVWDMLHSFRDSKIHPLILVEEDTWKTDEVFGDYLCLSNELREFQEQLTLPRKQVQLCYYRREKCRRTFTVRISDKNQLIEWIKEDARKQVISEFRRRWALISEELQIAVKTREKYTAQPMPVQFDFSLLFKLYELSPSAALLELGKTVEHYLLELNRCESANQCNRSFSKLLEEANLPDELQKLLLTVRRKYNQLKHVRTYVLDPSEIQTLLENLKKLQKKLPE